MEEKSISKSRLMAQVKNMMELGNTNTKTAIMNMLRMEHLYAP